MLATPLQNSTLEIAGNHIDDPELPLQGEVHSEFGAQVSHLRAHLRVLSYVRQLAGVDATEYGNFLLGVGARRRGRFACSNRKHEAIRPLQDIPGGLGILDNRPIQPEPVRSPARFHSRID